MDQKPFIHSRLKQGLGIASGVRKEPIALCGEGVLNPFLRGNPRSSVRPVEPGWGHGKVLNRSRI